MTRLYTPSLDIVLYNDVLHDTIDLAALSLSDGTPLAVLQWFGSAMQCRLVSHNDNLQVQFEGWIYTPSLSQAIKNPLPNKYLTLMNSEGCYFTNDDTSSFQEAYQLNTNAASLRLDDLSLNLPSFAGGVKLDLHVNYAGSIEAEGKISILSSIDVQNG